MRYNGLFRALMFVPMIITLGMAFYMVANGVKGYGWVLFVALLILPSYKTKTETKKNGDQKAEKQSPRDL